MQRIPLLLLSLLPLLAGVSRAQDAANAWRDFTDQAAPELEELAGWCIKKRMHFEGHRHYKLLLRLRPDHAKARKTLKFKKKDGRWEQASSYRTPKQRESRYFDEYDALWFPLEKRILEESFALLERKEGPAAAALKDEILDFVLSVAPDHEGARRLRGESLHDGKWLLASSARALEQRPALAQSAREHVKKVREPVSIEIPERLYHMGVAWTAACKSGSVIVVSSTTEEEAQTVCRMANATGTFFNETLRQSLPFPYKYTIYVLGTPEDRDAFLDGRDDITPADRERFRNLSSGWFANDHLAVWHDDPANRLDSACRQTLKLFFLKAFKIGSEQGWVTEGMGLYLSGLVCKTRLTWTVREPRYESAKPSRWSRQMEGAFDWLPPGRELFEESQVPSLAQTLQRDVNALEDREMLLSYVFAAYLLEGRRSELSSILFSLPKAEDGSRVVFDQLGANSLALTEELQRWLDETL